MYILKICDILCRFAGASFLSVRNVYFMLLFLRVNKELMEKKDSFVFLETDFQTL